MGSGTHGCSRGAAPVYGRPARVEDVVVSDCRRYRHCGCRHVHDDELHQPGGVVQIHISHLNLPAPTVGLFRRLDRAVRDVRVCVGLFIPGPVSGGRRVPLYRRPVWRRSANQRGVAFQPLPREHGVGHSRARPLHVKRGNRRNDCARLRLVLLRLHYAARRCIRACRGVHAVRVCVVGIHGARARYHRTPTSVKMKMMAKLKLHLTFELPRQFETS